MLVPWDGIWTYELLRDLCGGVTRNKGAIRASCKDIGPFKIVRNDRDYIIAGASERDGEGAVRWLNRHHAVPLYDNGKAWKFCRPEPDDNCPICSTTGQLDCDECNGSGSLECDLGHEHDCEACWGSGTVMCECQKETAKSKPRKES